MSLPPTRARLPRRALSAAAALATICAGGALAAPAGASAAASVSANWAGYVALPHSAAHPFSSISGSWTVPEASCRAGHEAYSAVWVGLGGYHESAQALEQIGTEADCSSGGSSRYSAWYELVPAGPVNVSVRARPGDSMTASVTVRAHHVTLRLRNLTSGERFSITRAVSSIDTSSAEWIVEAPSSCFEASSCQTLPLTNFGTVAFSGASATLAGHTAPISSPYWSDAEIELRQSAFGSGGPAGFHRARADAGGAVVSAVPSELSAGLFSVSWSEQTLEGGAGVGQSPYYTARRA